MEANRRFWLVASIVLLGMFFLILALIFELIFGLLGNAHWNSIVDCNVNQPFPSGVDKKNGNLFGGQRFSCHFSFVTGSIAVLMSPLKRNADLDFSPFLIFLILSISVAVYILPIVKKKYRTSLYAVIMELSFGILGLICFTIFLVIGFSLSETQDVYVKIVNEFDSHFSSSLYPGKIQPWPICNITLSDAEKNLPNPNKGHICLQEETWYAIILLCAINGENMGSLTSIGGRASMEIWIKDRNEGWLDKKLVFQSTNSSKTASYSYKDLENMGFCPFVELRATAYFMVFCTILCFVSVACLTCCLKGRKPSKVDPNNFNVLMNDLDDDPNHHNHHHKQHHSHHNPTIHLLHHNRKKTPPPKVDPDRKKTPPPKVDPDLDPKKPELDPDPDTMSMTSETGNETSKTGQGQKKKKKKKKAGLFRDRGSSSTSLVELSKRKSVKKSKQPKKYDSESSLENLAQNKKPRRKSSQSKQSFF